MWTPHLIQLKTGSQISELQLGHPMVDDYLAFVGSRARPNTWLAVTYDLKVFFAVVGKEPGEVTATDVFGFIRNNVHPVEDRTWSDSRTENQGWRHGRSCADSRVSPACSGIWWSESMPG